MADLSGQPRNSARNYLHDSSRGANDGAETRGNQSN